MLLISALVLIGGTTLLFHNVIPSNALCHRCNIIVIVVDSLRANRLPCYGYTLPTAPNICRFAAASSQFTQAYANSTWTRPSNMSIITGLHPTNHGMIDPIANQLSRKITTLPQFLYRHGYETTLVINKHSNMMIELGFGRGFRTIALTEASINDETLDTWLAAIDGIRSANAKRDSPQDRILSITKGDFFK